MSNHGLQSRRQHCPRPKINFMRRPVIQRLVRPLLVVEHKIIGKSPPCLRHHHVVVKIQLLVFDRAPEALDKDITPLPSSSEIQARELHPLVRLENLRLRDSERPLQRLQTEARVQCRRKLQGKDISAAPVQDRHQMNKTVSQRDVCDIRCLRLVWSVNRNTFQKIGINLITGYIGRQPRLRINRLQPFTRISRRTRLRLTL